MLLNKETETEYLNITHCQVVIKSPVPVRSMKLSTDQPVLYLDGWLLKQATAGTVHNQRPICHI